MRILKTDICKEARNICKDNKNSFCKDDRRVKVALREKVFFLKNIKDDRYLKITDTKLHILQTFLKVSSIIMPKHCHWGK